MSNVYLGQIVMFGGNFAPRGFAFCNGQLLSIAQNSALFSLLGTYYGGDGRTTFGVPNLQSRLPLHYGQGPGLSSYTIGESTGTPTVTLTTQTMTGHTHTLNASMGPGNTTDVGNTVLPATSMYNNSPVDFYAAQQSGGPQLNLVALNPAACSINGGSQAHSNLMPSLCITFVIALEGLFPSRN